MIPRAPHVSRVPAFFASAFTWNLALGMTHILIPLYADHLGFSGVAIGSLVSLPVLVQIGFNLLGGAWTDRVGGKRLAMVSAAMFAVAGVVFAFASSFAALFAAQLCIILSRALFWPATWSLGSLLPGERSRGLGLLNSITNGGQIVGTIVAGLTITWFGFATGFWTVALVGGAVAFVLMAAFVAPGPRAAAGHPPILAAYRALARRRSIWFAVACAYISALPFSLGMSFYPLLLVGQGFSSDAAGWMLALRAVGSVAAGVGAAHFVRRVSARSIPVATALAVGLAVLGTAAFHHPGPVSALLLLVGFGSGVMTLYFQLLISDLSTIEARGSALALGGLGWGLSHFSTPLLMGALKDAFGIETAFYAMGVVATAWALMLAPLHAWAFRDGKPR
ncbi:MAG TPA: MFS transporter [Burkholderiales bacterium]|nr:MFS transporter [Burkholderiales bacterium]